MLFLFLNRLKSLSLKIFESKNYLDLKTIEYKRYMNLEIYNNSYIYK